MAKLCNDFTYLNKNLNSISVDKLPKYIFVDFEDNPETALGMERDMEYGETNRYRNEPNYFYDKWSDGLPIEFNIVKNPEVYEYQYDMEFTKEDIKEITRWLTSSHFPEWLNIDSLDNEENVRYNGWFSNIETWCVSGRVYGLRLYFKCTTSFGYTDDIVDEITVSSYDYKIIKNNSDELYDYCYPTIDIHPVENGEIFICNLSDCTLRENGTLILENPESTYLNVLLDTIDAHALANGCTVEYCAPEDTAFNIVPLCNDTAIQFNLVNIYGYKIKCTAFYLEDTKEYRIIEGGFMYLKVKKDLPVHIDCKRLIISDELGRMIPYTDLGVNDVDFMYWLALINGNNSILFYGNCRFVITHNESRKVGE